MPEAIAVTIVEAVRQRLADAVPTLSQQFEPVRNYSDWDYELKDDQKLRVDVVLASNEQLATPATRSSINYTVPVNICLRKKLGTDKRDDDTGELDVAAIDSLMLLVQEIHELFTLERLADFTCGAWQATKILAAPIPQHLREMGGQFTAIIQVTFLASRKPCSA